MEDHERHYRAGYLQALLDAARLLSRRARKDISKVDDAVDVIKLQHNAIHPDSSSSLKN